MSNKPRKGKEWRNQRQARGALSAVIKGRDEAPAGPTQDPTTTNKQRMQMRRAARLYRQIGDK